MRGKKKRRREVNKESRTCKRAQFHQRVRVADLSLQQGDLVGKQLDHVLLSEGGGKQKAEGGACGGEQAGQNQTLPWPKNGTS